MGRPRMPKGTYGKISTAQVGPARYKSRARFRDLDGASRSVVRFGETKGRAEKALKEALRDRVHAAQHGGISPATTIGQLADVWLASDAVQGLAVNSRATYGYVVKNQVKPTLKVVQLGELRPSDVNRALTKIRATSGPSAAKTAKKVLSGMCELAVSYDALATNPMRDAIKIKGSGVRPTRRVLTREEDEALRDAMRCDPQSLAAADNPVGADLADLVEWMLGTGCRIGEALAARHGLNQDGEPLLDLEAGTWEINATLIRVGGVRRRRELESKPERTWEEEEELAALSTLAPGLHIQERTKSDAGWRRIALPWYCVEIATRRHAETRFRPESVDVVFPAPTARALRDPRNTARDWLDVRTRLGYDWANFHKFRSTVATRLLEANIDPAKVADHMGHSRPSMTLDHYAGRNVVVSDAARILDR